MYWLQSTDVIDDKVSDPNAKRPCSIQIKKGTRLHTDKRVKLKENVLGHAYNALWLECIAKWL